MSCVPNVPPEVPRPRASAALPMGLREGSAEQQEGEGPFQLPGFFTDFWFLTFYFDVISDVQKSHRNSEEEFHLAGMGPCLFCFVTLPLLANY